MEVSRFILNRRAIAATRQTEDSRAQRAQPRRFPTPVHHRGAAEALTLEVAAHSHALANVFVRARGHVRGELTGGCALGAQLGGPWQARSTQTVIPLTPRTSTASAATDIVQQIACFVPRASQLR